MAAKDVAFGLGDRVCTGVTLDIIHYLWVGFYGKSISCRYFSSVRMFHVVVMVMIVDLLAATQWFVRWQTLAWKLAGPGLLYCRSQATYFHG